MSDLIWDAGELFFCQAEDVSWSGAQPLHQDPRRTESRIIGWTVEVKLKDGTNLDFGFYPTLPAAQEKVKEISEAVARVATG